MKQVPLLACRGWAIQEKSQVPSAHNPVHRVNPPEPFAPEMRETAGLTDIASVNVRNDEAAQNEKEVHAGVTEYE